MIIRRCASRCPAFALAGPLARSEWALTITRFLGKKLFAATSPQNAANFVVFQLLLCTKIFGISGPI